ncbi:MAG: TIGR03936 family radical SAM-associated protein, partial [Chloroflexota bacterium]
MQRLRICFHKCAELQYIGNLDLQKIWERYLRRARVPISYSQGFHPQPKIQLAAPLPLGFLSRNDFVDIWVDVDGYAPETLLSLLTQTGQPGIAIISITPVELHSPALPCLVLSALYQVTLLDPADYTELHKRIQELLARAQIQRERRGKMYDLRPLIEWLEIASATPEKTELCMQLASREAATGRPDEVLDALGLDAHAA